MTGCDWWRETKPSFLIVAVDNLGFNEVICSPFTGEQDEAGGLFQLCRDSIRFSHAFASSTESVPALASILTGQLVRDHKVYNNAPTFLSAGSRSVAESALFRRYRTAMISGGPPVFRRSGLDQGFSLFEDNIEITKKLPYRPVLKNFEMLFDWLDNTEDELPFFAVVYLADLQFAYYPTQNNLGEPREIGYRGQLDEIDESLEFLISELKERKKWENTTVIFVGLNGRTSGERAHLLTSDNLFSERVHVPLLIKPAQEKKRDSADTWKVDVNVSHADIGKTLFEMLGAPANTSDKEFAEFPVASLARALQSPAHQLDDERPIEILSQIRIDQKESLVRLSVRQGQFFYLFGGARPELFNTLTDRMEMSAFSPYARALPKWWKKDLEQPADQALLVKSKLLARKSRLAFDLFMPQGNSTRGVRDLVKALDAYPEDDQLNRWAARIALRAKDWEWLRSLGIENSNPSWTLTAHLAGGLKTKKGAPLPEAESCLQFFRAPVTVWQTPHYSLCDNELFLKLLKWIKEDKARTPEAQKAKDDFLNAYRSFDLSRGLGELNYVNGLNWDVRLESPSGPHLVELLLNLPEHRRYLPLIWRDPILK